MSKILVINSGSATLKFKIFEARTLAEQITGQAERIGLKDSFLIIKKGKKQQRFNYASGLKDHGQALSQIFFQLKGDLGDIIGVGHRVVHGGTRFSRPTAASAKNIELAKKYNRLAPLHNPVNLLCVETAKKLLPQAKQVMVFDTAYYANLPDYAARYPLPEKFFKLGIKKYGFHGISHESAAAIAGKKLNLKKGRIITCHLGSGSSITATAGGRAIETSLGFTPVSGIMMSTRCGDIDPSIVLYLISELGMSAAEVDKLLNKQSGLLGVSGFLDMREILAAAGQKVVGYKASRRFTALEKAKAKLALKMFIYRIVKYIGSFAAIMGGADAIVFTGGIGERSPVIRKLVVDEIKKMLSFRTLVVPANEELRIAQEVKKFI